MKLQRFEVAGLAHFSYALSHRGQAALIDPERNLEPYLAFAAQNHLRITHVLETHIHADYCSGAKELADLTGAELALSAYDVGEQYAYQFPHRGLHEGDEISFGDGADRVTLTTRHTPGHTPEHLSFLIKEARGHGMPFAMLSGDFVMVAAAGRPDLLGEAAKLRLAAELHESMFCRIADLPDGVELHPAHGAGSMCGAGMSERPQSTLGYERRAAALFGVRDKAEFVRQVLGSLPPFPDYYRRMKQVNAAGPASLHGQPELKPLSAGEFERLREHGATVVDLRQAALFGAGHVPGSLNIASGSDLPVWAAWLVPYDTPILLVGGPHTDYAEARRALWRVGLDNVAGGLAGGFESWAAAAHAQARLPQIAPEELAERVRHGAFLLDVRSDGEWAAGHIAGAKHIFGGDLAKQTAGLPADCTIHVICGSGYRSSALASLLLKFGFHDVANVSGGMNRWREMALEQESGGNIAPGV